jgi:hypothetical protein
MRLKPVTVDFIHNDFFDRRTGDTKANHSKSIYYVEILWVGKFGD